MKKNIYGIIALFIIIIYSCSSDDSNSSTTTTVAEDKQNITTTFESFYGCLNALDDGDLSNYVLYSMFNSTNNEYNDSWLKELTNKFEEQYGEIVLNNKLQYAQNTGVYTWNSTTQAWVKTANSSVITLKFPSRQSIEIDSELSLNSYSDISTSFNNESYFLPNSINLTLKRASNTIFSINLSNVTFENNTNFTMPTNADITIVTAPFTHTFQWRRNNSTEFKLSYSSNTTLGCGTAFDMTVKLQDSDYGNITSLEEDVKTVNGSLSEGNLKVVYGINVEAIAAFDNPNENQINNNSDAEVFYNNQKIGDLIYKKINNKVEIFIVYSDGTQENVNTYTGNFQTRVENIFANYIN